MGKVGCAIVPAVIVITVVAVVFSALRSCDTAAIRSKVDPNASPFANVSTLSGTSTVVDRSGSTFDVVATTQTSDLGGLERRLSRLRFSGEGSTRVWESEPLADDLARAEVAVVDDTIFAGYDDELLALDAETGATRWRTTLRDEVTVNCEDCFAVVGGRLVVRTADAYVTAFAPRSAEPVWTKRLRSPQGSIAVPGDQLLVIDEPEDAAARTTVALVDPASGAVRRTTSPTCPDNPQTPWDLELRPDDEIWALAGTTDVVAAFGFGDGCVVRWNPGDGTTRWTSRLNGAGSLGRDTAVIGSEDLVVTAGSALVTVDLSSGKAQLLGLPNETSAVPGVIVGRTLVANTVTTRGTGRNGLAAWNLADGSSRWDTAGLAEVAPVSTGVFRSDALFEGSPRSLLVPVGDDGLNLMVFDGADGTFSVSPVDLATGDLRGEVRRAYLREYEGIASLTVEAQVEDRVLVSIDSLLQALPVSGRGTIVAFPEQ